MLVGALRGDRAHVVRLLIALGVLVLAVAGAAVAILSLRGATAETAEVVLVLAGAAVVLGFAVAPLVLGATDPLDPRRFVVLAARPGPLAATLALAGLLSIPSLVLIVLSVCGAVVRVAHGADPVWATLSAALGVLTCVMLARVSEAIAAMVVRERRSRELTSLFLVAVIVIVVPVGVFLASLEWDGVVPAQLREAVSVLTLTPLGAAWAVPAASGGAAWLSVVIAVATLGALVAAWFAIVGRVLSRTERPVAARERRGLGWFAVAPGTAAGAVAARSLVYWFRDRRYLVNVVIVPVAAVLTVVPLLVVGVPLEIVVLVPVPIMALFFGWLPHNDVAYDSTAVWMHVASGMRGLADRVGRLVPVLLIALPVLAIAIPVAISLHGRWAVLPAMIGVAASLFLAGLGLSSIASALSPYPVSRPGDSPFQQPQRTGSGGVVSQGMVLCGAIVLSAPALWWSWLTLTRDVSYATPALWGGIAGGVVVLAVGLLIGAAVFERGSSRLMEFVETS